MHKFFIPLNEVLESGENNRRTDTGNNRKSLVGDKVSCWERLRPISHETDSETVANDEVY